MALAVSTGRYAACAIPTPIAACRACSQAMRVVWLRRSAMSISSAKEYEWPGLTLTGGRLAAGAISLGDGALEAGICQGVSGEAGARSCVSLQAAKTRHVAKARTTCSAGGKVELAGRGGGCRPCVRANLTKDGKDVLVQQTIPCLQSRHVVALWLHARKWRWLGKAFGDIVGTLAGTNPVGGMLKPVCQRRLVRVHHGAR